MGRAAPVLLSGYSRHAHRVFARGMKNALSFDLEDYYHVSAFAEQISTAEWQNFASRVERNTLAALDLLGETGQRATFFTLGWVAERYPHLIRRIADAGHEIACHSHRHRLIYQMTQQEFLEDTYHAKSVLEQAGGQAVRGYRAPSFSLTENCLWAFNILAELGFTYDSSIFPVRHPNYGMAAAPRTPFRVETPYGPIVEFPLPTLEVAGRRSPIGGGAYLRLLPYAYTRWAMRYLNHKEARPVCVYLHPWELDPDQPKMEGRLTARIRHYIGLRGVRKKLRRMLRDFEFAPMGELIPDQKLLPCEVTLTR